MLSVQIDEISMIEKATQSSCDKIRYGSEFCEWKLPNLNELMSAHNLSKDVGKGFAYIAPRLSDESLGKFKEQLDYLNEQGKSDVIINDLGALHHVNCYSNLIPYLGRQMFHIPARSPWKMTKFKDRLPSWVNKIIDDGGNLYSQTSLNYDPTIQLYKEHGIKGVDLDWIPRCFPYYTKLASKNLKLSIHLHLIPVAITRKCHTARFLDEKNPESCSKPCSDNSFLLKRNGLDTELILHGNVVFRLVSPSIRDLRKLRKQNDYEFIISMGPHTKIENTQKINEYVRLIDQ